MQELRALPQAGARSTAIQIRRLFASMLAALVFGVAIAASLSRTIADITLVFINAPRDIVPPGHNAQVKRVRTIVPAGSTILYITDKEEAWQLGLWQRSLYPEYAVLPVSGLAHVQGREFQEQRSQVGIDFALSAGNPPLNPGFQWQVRLAPYPNSIPIVLGKLATE